MDGLRLLAPCLGVPKERASSANSMVVAPIVKGLGAILDLFSSCARFGVSDELEEKNGE